MRALRERHPTDSRLLFPAAALLLLAPLYPLHAQEPPRTVTVAERLAEEGRYAEAADTLLAYLQAHPDDAGTRWRAARLLYWAGETSRAAEEYLGALELTPDDPSLRLEAAEVLAAAGRTDRARVLVTPLAEAGSREIRAGALTVLGTLDYWDGDLSAAIRRLEAALSLDPDHRAATELLHEVRGLAGPWVRAALEAFDDNQPYRRGDATLEGGVPLTPLWTVGVDAVVRVLDPGGPTTTTHKAEVTLRGFLPGARLDLAGGLGGVRQEEGAWTGRVEAGLRLPGQVRLRVEADRRRYLWTTASADTLLLVDGAGLVVDRADAPGWAGEAVIRRETFPDGNRIWTAYAWVLAPVAPWVRAGLATAYQSADESRWSAATEVYEPYFTPDEQRVQSVLLELRGTTERVTLGLNGSYGFQATDLSPGIQADRPGIRPGPGPGPPGGAAEPTKRSFSPWSMTASAEIRASGRVGIRLEVERSTTAFYELTRGQVALSLGVPRGPRR